MGLQHNILSMILFPNYQGTWQGLFDFWAIENSPIYTVGMLLKPIQVIVSSLRSPEYKKQTNKQTKNKVTTYSTLE